MRLDFFIIGGQKCGTTALDRFLKTSPHIQMPSAKETHFFDDESKDWRSPDYDALHTHFNWAAPAGVKRGEATPIYCYWPGVLERLHRYNARARLIMGLRHPSFRAYSHWRMETKRGDERLPFCDAISPSGRARVSESPNGAHRVYSYVERGFYARQIRRALALFPKDQIHFFRTDTLWLKPKAVLAQIQDHLGVSRLAISGGAYVAPIEARDVTGSFDAARPELDRLFAEDVKETSALTGLSLSDWLAPDYSEPMPTS